MRIGLKTPLNHQIWRADWPTWRLRGLSLILFVLVFATAVNSSFKFYASTQNDNIREAALRYKIPPLFKTPTFVSIEDEDPTPEFLARFKNVAFSVRRGSQCKTVARGKTLFEGYYYADSATDQKVEYINLGAVQWINPLKAEVWTDTRICTVVLQWNGWGVTKEEQGIYY